MGHGYIAGTIDVAELALIAFTLFFIGLIAYLLREGRREGFPLEDELTGMVEAMEGPLLLPRAKYFRLPFGRGTVAQPGAPRDPVNIAAKRFENFPGAPYIPTGNPLVDGVGPAAYANRADVPDLDAHGHPRIVPIGSANEFWVAREDVDPRGKQVIGADGAVAGVVTDLWVDRAETVLRYLEIRLADGSTVLAPITIATVSRAGVSIDAINAADFAAVPKLKSATEITRYEEERVIAYYGGGYLYTGDRQEPWL